MALVGKRKNECGGSVYYMINDQLGTNIPHPDCNEISKEIAAIHAAARKKLILAAHDISDGGVAVTLAEMSFKNNIGCKIDFSNIKDDYDLAPEIKLFSESSGFVLEVAPDNLPALEKTFQEHGAFLKIIGQTIKEPFLIMQDWININITDAMQVWHSGLRNKL